jgi:uncharacterized protein YlxW (UPF0749 family)
MSKVNGISLVGELLIVALDEMESSREQSSQQYNRILELEKENFRLKEEIQQLEDKISESHGFWDVLKTKLMRKTV